MLCSWIDSWLGCWLFLCLMFTLCLSVNFLSLSPGLGFHFLSYFGVLVLVHCVLFGFLRLPPSRFPLSRYQVYVVCLCFRQFLVNDSMCGGVSIPPCFANMARIFYAQDSSLFMPRKDFVLWFCSQQRHLN